MGFGLSGSTTSTQMIGADATIAWIDAVDGPQAVDYYISAYTQVSWMTWLQFVIYYINYYSYGKQQMFLFLYYSVIVMELVLVLM